MRSNQIKVLSDIDHVLERPGMYLGAVQSESLDRWVLNEENKFEFRSVSFTFRL